MKTDIEIVPKTSILVWLVTVMIFSLPGLNDCKSHAHGTQNPSPVDKTASSDWQTILLREKGILFKLPTDWRHQDPDTKLDGENGVIEGLEWNSPRKELIRILISTYHKSFISPEGKVSSKEEMLEDKFSRVARIARGDSSYSEVKKVQLTGVEGVFKVLRADFGDDAIGVRKGIIWTGYRIYQGKFQELEININASPQFETLIRMIFDTIEIEQDKAVG